MGDFFFSAKMTKKNKSSTCLCWSHLEIRPVFLLSLVLPRGLESLEGRRRLERKRKAFLKESKLLLIGGWYNLRWREWAVITIIIRLIFLMSSLYLALRRLVSGVFYKFIFILFLYLFIFIYSYYFLWITFLGFGLEYIKSDI